MDRNYDDSHLYDLQYAPRAEPDPLSQSSYGTVPFPSQQSWNSDPEPHITPNSWDLDEELAHMLSAASGPKPASTPLDLPPRRTSRRRARAESSFLDGGQRITHITVLIAAIAVCAASMLGWAVSYSYGQLRTIAETVLPASLAHWWPLTVYGPWFVAALSILRATVQHRSAHRSWGVILTASGMAVVLCVCRSVQPLLTVVMLGIPPITALVCFWELVGQISSKYRARLTTPASHGAHAQRRAKP